MSFQGLPDYPACEELKALPRWVSHRDKIPINVKFGGNASSAQPSTWASYERALTFCQRHDHDRLGFVWTRQDGFTAIDLDKCIDPETGYSELAQAIIDLGETYCEVSPSGTGLHLWARGPVERSRAIKAIGVEYYSEGRYFTVTGNHVAGTPMSIEEAPQTMALIAARVAAYDEELAKARTVDTGEKPGPETRNVTAVGSTYYRAVCELALKKPEAWFPVMFPKAQLRNGKWRVTSKALGRELEEDISLVSSGITDFGVHDMGDPRGGGRQAIELAMEWMGFQHANDAARWLCTCMGVTPESMGWVDRAPKPDLVDTTGLIEQMQRRKDGTLVDMTTGEIIEEIAPIVPLVAVDYTLPGLGGAIAASIMSTAWRPSAEFAFLPALAILSVMFGRRFMTPTGAPLNLYLIGVGVSGSGKDHALHSARMFLHETKLSTLLGPGDVTSDSTIEKVLRRSPCVLLPIDEVGIFLQGTTGRNAGGWERRIRKVLLELYGLGRGPWSGKESMDPKKSVDPIWNPTLSFMGFSTQTELYDGFEEKNLSDGFLARMLFVEVADRPARQKGVKPYDVPASVKAMVKGATKATGNMGGAAMAGFAGQCKLVPWLDDEAEGMFDAFAEWQNETIDRDPTVSGYVNRAAENALRIATLAALARDYHKPSVACVTADDVAWSIGIVQRSLYTLDTGIKAYMAGSDFERAHKDALRIITAAGTAGIKESDFVRARGMGKLEPRYRASVIDHLTMAHLIVVQAGSSAKGGRPGRRFFAAERPADG